MRNRACFEGKIIKKPFDLICFVVVFIKYWASLNVHADQDALRRGADAEVAMGSLRTHPSARAAISVGRRDGDTGEVENNSDADDNQE
jgi:hypothetical protein